MSSHAVAAKRVGWAQGIYQRWIARHTPRDEVTLHQRNVYILPTRSGLFFALTMLVLLLASINYQLNLGYLLTFLLSGSAIVSMHMTHNTLRGLRLHLSDTRPTHVGRSWHIQLVVEAPTDAKRFGLGVRLHSEHAPADWAWFDIQDNCAAQVPLKHAALLRGRQSLPAITIQTEFPFGLFRAWSVWRPAQEVLAYPRLESPAPAWPTPLHGETSAQAAPQPRPDEPQGVRPYRRGDRLASIAWKKSTHAALVSRDHAQALAPTQWLDWESTLGLSTEARLSRLSAWITVAEQCGWRYGLRLPQSTIELGAGTAHCARCLTALALWPGVGPAPMLAPRSR